MKTAILSDVHGNWPALEATLNAIDELKCDRIISLGDVSGYYCMVNECIDEFRKRDIINIMGNHDSYVLGNGKCPRSYTVNMIIEYQKKIMTEINRDYLMHSVSQIDNQFLSARHGGWDDPLDEYVSNFNFEISDLIGVPIYCSGHTHVQMIQKRNNKTYFNPGSVGQPRDGDCRAGFAVVKNKEVQLYRIAYDIDLIANKMKTAGFEPRIYECLYRGTRIGAFNG